MPILMRDFGRFKGILAGICDVIWKKRSHEPIILIWITVNGSATLKLSIVGHISVVRSFRWMKWYLYCTLGVCVKFHVLFSRTVATASSSISALGLTSAFVDGEKKNLLVHLDNAFHQNGFLSEFFHNVKSSLVEVVDELHLVFYHLLKTCNTFWLSFVLLNRQSRIDGSEANVEADNASESRALQHFPCVQAIANVNIRSAT